MLFPDVTKILGWGTSVTLSEDGYVTFIAVSGSSYYWIKINGIDCSVRDNSANGIYITTFFGYAKSGDVVTANVGKIMVYGLY